MKKRSAFQKRSLILLLGTVSGLSMFSVANAEECDCNFSLAPQLVLDGPSYTVEPNFTLQDLYLSKVFSGEELDQVSAELLSSSSETTSSKVESKSEEETPDLAENKYAQDKYAAEAIKDGLQIKSNRDDIEYSLSLTGKSNRRGASRPFDTPDHSWQRSISFAGQSDLGFAKTEFRTQFSESEKRAGYSLRDLQFASDRNGGHRSMAEIYFGGKFLDDRLSFSTTRKISDRLPVGFSGADTHWAFPFRLDVPNSQGMSEQHRFSAVLLQSESLKFTMSGLLNRVDSNFREMTDFRGKDPLRLRNRQTRQLRANVEIDRFNLHMTTRESMALDGWQEKGWRPRQSEMDVGATVTLADFRTDGHGLVADKLLALVPDSTWFSVSQGTHENLSLAGAAPSRTQTINFGFNRSWDIADANVNYWKSSVDQAPSLPESSRWEGQGLDIGSNVYFGKWYIYGGLSYYDAGNFAQWNNSNEGSFTGSFLLTWQSESGVDVKAGITSYNYGFDMLDYGGLNRYGMERYELSLDVSRIMKEKLERDVQLKFLTSFGRDENRSIWPSAEYNSGEKNLFAGFMFTLPL